MNIGHVLCIALCCVLTSAYVYGAEGSTIFEREMNTFFKKRFIRNKMRIATYRSVMDKLLTEKMKENQAVCNSNIKGLFTDFLQPFENSEPFCSWLVVDPVFVERSGENVISYERYTKIQNLLNEFVSKIRGIPLFLYTKSGGQGKVEVRAFDSFGNKPSQEVMKILYPEIFGDGGLLESLEAVAKNVVTTDGKLLLATIRADIADFLEKAIVLWRNVLSSTNARNRVAAVSEFSEIDFGGGWKVAVRDRSSQNSPVDSDEPVELDIDEESISVQSNKSEGTGSVSGSEKPESDEDSIHSFEKKGNVGLELSADVYSYDSGGTGSTLKLAPSKKVFSKNPTELKSAGIQTEEIAEENRSSILKFVLYSSNQLILLFNLFKTHRWGDPEWVTEVNGQKYTCGNYLEYILLNDGEITYEDELINNVSELLITCDDPGKEEDPLFWKRSEKAINAVSQYCLPKVKDIALPPESFNDTYGRVSYRLRGLGDFSDFISRSGKGVVGHGGYTVGYTVNQSGYNKFVARMNSEGLLLKKEVDKSLFDRKGDGVGSTGYTIGLCFSLFSNGSLPFLTGVKNFSSRWGSHVAGRKLVDPRDPVYKELFRGLHREKLVKCALRDIGSLYINYLLKTLSFSRPETVEKAVNFLNAYSQKIAGVEIISKVTEESGGAYSVGGTPQAVRDLPAKANRGSSAPVTPSIKAQGIKKAVERKTAADTEQTEKKSDTAQMTQRNSLSSSEGIGAKQKQDSNPLTPRIVRRTPPRDSVVQDSSTERKKSRTPGVPKEGLSEIQNNRYRRLNNTFN